MQKKTLYRQGKKGEILVWSVWTEGDLVFIEHGQKGGQLQVTKRQAEAKNVGRSNETTSAEQAEKEAESLYQHKLTRKYRKTLQEAEEVVFLPMLAHKYSEKRHGSTWPKAGSRKLDGVRSMAFRDKASGQVKLISRSGREWTAVPHINQALDKIISPDTVLDGELYLHGLTLQEINRRVKKNRPESSEIKYHVFDVPSDKKWADREHDMHRLKRLVSHESLIVFEQTELVSSYAEAKALHDKFVSEGYEGLILKELDGLYEFGQRGHGLLKIKEFDDKEFKIVDYTQGSGRDEGCVVWVCEQENGKRFEVVPNGSLDNRKRQYKKADEFIGSWLKVQFFGRTEANIPYIPKGLAIRLNDDM